MLNFFLTRLQKNEQKKLKKKWASWLSVLKVFKQPVTDVK